MNNAKNDGKDRRVSTAVWIALAVIIAAGGLLRFAWFGEIAESPDFATPAADAAFHDYWARAIATGDWSVPEGESDPRLREVPFLRPPGYTYFLALIYKLAGPSYAAPRIVQFALGLLNAVLLFFLVGALLDRPSGLIAAALGATYWGLIYFEGQLQAPVLIVTLTLLLLLALHRWAGKGTIPGALLSGLMLGALVLVSANALLLLPAAAGWMWWVLHGKNISRVQSAVRIGAFVAGAAIAISPATIRNAVVADDFVLVSCNGALNLYIGNNEKSDGVSSRIPDLLELAGTSGWSWFTYDRIVQGVWKKEGRQLRYSEVSSYFTRKSLDHILSDPGHFLSLCLKRSLLFWGPDEVSNNKAIGVEKKNSAVLRYLPPFPVMVSLSLAGALLLLFDRFGSGLGRKDSKKKRSSISVDPAVSLTALCIFTWFLSYVPFLAAGRFRLPVVPLLFLFAAYGLRKAYLSFLSRNWWRLALLPAAWAVLFLLLNISFADNDVDVAWWHTDRAVAHMREGQFADAEVEFQAALAANPGYVDARVNYAMMLAMTDRYAESIEQYQNVAVHRPDRFDARIMLASLLTTTGRRDEAIEEMRDVIRRNPDLAEAYFELGRALIESRKLDEGMEVMRRCLAINPQYSAARTNLAVALNGIGDYEGAIREYRLAISGAPDVPETHYQLGNALLTVKDYAGAESSFRDAMRLNPDYVEPVIHLGMVFNLTDRQELALAQFRRAMAMDRRNMVARCNLGGSLANLGRLDEAIQVLEEALTIDPTHELARERLEVLRRIVREQGR